MPQLTILGRFDFQRGSSRGQDHCYYWERTTVLTDVVAGPLKVNRGVPLPRSGFGQLWLRNPIYTRTRGGRLLARSCYQWFHLTGAHGRAFLASRQLRASMQPRFSSTWWLHGQYSHCIQFCLKTLSFWMIWTENPHQSNWYCQIRKLIALNKH